MKKKISESIQAKTFLSMMALLLVCCIIIYAMVMVFLPKNYQTELESQATSDFYRLMETLERSGWEAGSEEILAFSMKNNATVRIADGSGQNHELLCHLSGRMADISGFCGDFLGCGIPVL